MFFRPVGWISAASQNLSRWSYGSSVPPGYWWLLWSAQPELMGDVQLTYWILEQTALPITTTEGCGGDTIYDVPNNTFGWGRLDAYDAVDLAVNNNWDIPWLDVDPVSGIVGPGGMANVTLIFDTTGMTAYECYTGTLKIEFNDPYTTEVLMPVEVCAKAEIYLPIVSKSP